MLWLLTLVLVGIPLYIIYKRNCKASEHSSHPTQHDHAIIIGGSIGGMVTAAYLTKHFSRITIIESDDVMNDTLMRSTPSELLDYRCQLTSPASLGRSGVPQMYQLHILEGEGYKILQELFPRLTDILFNEYNIRTYVLGKESRIIIDGTLMNQDLTEEMRWLGVDRFTLDTVLRRELCAQYGSSIEWICKSRVTKLLVDRSLNTVRGVQYHRKEDTNSSSIDLFGDFIIDCTGKNSSSTKWLKDSLDLIIPSEQLHFGLGYVTFIGERFKTGNSSLDQMSIVASTTIAPEKNVGCSVTPIRMLETTDENSLGMLATIVVNCVNSEFPPNDSYEHLLEWAEENLDLDSCAILKSTKVHSPLLPYRRAIDDRKYVELLGKKWPRNYVMLGDALCTFNPQLGQGMTHACRQARELNTILAENRHQLKDISHIFHRRASAISEECWLFSVTNDWKTPTWKLIKTDKKGQVTTYERNENHNIPEANRFQLPMSIKLIQWYNYWFLQCASKSGKIATDFFQVMNQHKSPYILFKPKTILAICYAILTHYFSLSKKSGD